MRLPLLLSAGVLLVALLPCPPCRALLSRGPIPGARQARQPPFAGRGGRQLFPRVAAAAAAAPPPARQPRWSRRARGGERPRQPPRDPGEGETIRGTSHLAGSHLPPPPRSLGNGQGRAVSAASSQQQETDGDYWEIKRCVWPKRCSI
uniref:Corticotropin releasing hormone n=1 Tax=Canis lupus dingo TaxID=286419 RepID=A0A8C0KTC5_CANLU